MELSVKIKKPVMPSHVYPEKPPSTKGNGFLPSRHAIPVGDLSEEQAKEYAELMKTTFMEHWKNGGKTTR